MPNNNFQLNYDELVDIAKKFKDEGEDIARLHSETRQRVRDLYKEWVGEGAEKFFDEMEGKLLPAVQRLSLALFNAQDVSNDIMKIIQGADEETAGYFKDQLSGDDFGAGKFSQALDGLQGGGQGADDFGAGKFGEAVGGAPGSGSSAPEDFGAAKFGEAAGGSGEPGSHTPDTGQSSDGGSSHGGGGDGSQNEQKQPEETKATEQPAGGGGGGGSSSSQGLQGDLKNMGAGLGDMATQNAESGGPGGPASMPDHVYSDGGSPTPSGGSQPGGGGAAGNAGPSAPEGAGGAAAGAAGAAGAAAAGGAAKIIKEQQEKTSE